MRDLKEHLRIISEIKRRLAKYPAKMINLTISGAHLYGLAGPDSDIDYRGTFQINTNRLLGLEKWKDTLQFKQDEKEVVMSEVQKEVELCLKGNCNALERINAKQILSTAEFVELRQLLNNAWGKTGIYNSYKGMATFNYKKFILRGRNTVKKYLYVFRALMGGIYALETGTIEPNIVELNKYFKLKEIKELIKLKRGGSKLVPEDVDRGNLEHLINKLYEKIDKSFEKSKIPDRPTEEEIKKVNHFLVSMRKNYIT